MLTPTPAPDNDNRPALARHVPIIGVIAGDGRVTITDPTWRSVGRPSPAPASAAAPAFPSDPREA